MESVFLRSIVAEAASNLLITHGLSLGTPLVSRQLTAFKMVGLIGAWGVAQRNPALLGFAVGIMGMALVHCAASVMMSDGPIA